MAIKKILKWLFSSALNITIMTRLWRVSYGGWNDGEFRCFWFLKNALRFIETKKDLFVILENEITNKIINIRSNPQNIPPPIIYL